MQERQLIRQWKDKVSNGIFSVWQFVYVVFVGVNYFRGLMAKGDCVDRFKRKVSKRMTIAQAESLGLIEQDKSKKTRARKPKSERIPNPPSTGEETLALHLKAHKIEFRREFMFHPTRNWKLDFAIKHVKLAVEVEGGVERIGRHQRPEGFVEDMYKYNALIMQGWRLLRFSTKMVLNGEAIDTILEALGMGVLNVTGNTTENC